MTNIKTDYQKYKWFFTSSGKLVVGGKSAAQNDDLLKELKSKKTDYMIMHTSQPGSPFSVIISKIEDIKLADIEQTAIFTASFSRAWREGKQKAQIDLFNLSQIFKLKNMKVGMWGVKGKINRKTVSLGLVLTKQKGKLRAVPESAVKNSQILLKLRPGKIDKKDMLPKFEVILKDSYTQEELMAALPAGGVSISKPN